MRVRRIVMNRRRLVWIGVAALYLLLPYIYESAKIRALAGVDDLLYGAALSLLAPGLLIVGGAIEISNAAGAPIGWEDVSDVYVLAASIAAAALFWALVWWAPKKLKAWRRKLVETPPGPVRLLLWNAARPLPVRIVGTGIAGVGVLFGTAMVGLILLRLYGYFIGPPITLEEPTYENELRHFVCDEACQTAWEKRYGYRLDERKAEAEATGKGEYLLSLLRPYMVCRYNHVTGDKVAYYWFHKWVWVLGTYEHPKAKAEDWASDELFGEIRRTRDSCPFFAESDQLEPAPAMEDKP